MCVGLGYEISGKTLCIFQAEADERESRAEVAKPNYFSVTQPQPTC